MITFEQRLLMVLEGIERELKNIREILETDNYHGDKTEENDETNKD